MGIRRTALPFEGQFVQIPNAWVRDVRLSRRARGLLAEIWSHKVDWKINQASLEAAGPEGREALASAIKELKKAGYLRIEQARDGVSNQFGEIDYVVTDPFDSPVYGFPVERGSRSAGSPESGKPAPKNTRDKEHQKEENQELTLIPADAVSVESAFAEFWRVYPRKVGRKAALQKFVAAVKAGTPAQLIVERAARFAADPGRSRDLKFVPHAATWLHQERWADEEEPGSVRSSTVEHGRAVDAILRDRAGGHLRAVES